MKTTTQIVHLLCAFCVVCFCIIQIFMKIRRPNMQELHQEVDEFVPDSCPKKMPRIGISANRNSEFQSCIAEPYVQAVLKAGGAPVLIPVITDIAALTAVVDSLDGLLMSGGADINPLYVNEEPIPQLQDVDTYRDEFDLMLIRLAANRQIPIMGICRGHQIMNAAFGGTLYQDIYSQHNEPVLKHSQKMPRNQASHSVTLEDGRKIGVNSIHHQSVAKLAPEFVETAVAPDGINEGMRHQEKYIFSVQWHPEHLTDNTEPYSLQLFQKLVKYAELYSRAKDLHSRIVTIDSHTDTPMIFPGEFNIGKKEGGKVNLPYMEEGKIDAVFMVAYIPQGKRDDESLDAARNLAINRINEIKRQEKINPSRMGIAYSTEDLLHLKRQNKKAVFIGIENGYALGKNLQNISMFKEMGVSYITLCHNGDNDICDSARGKGEWGGLSPFGKEVVAEMNRLGIMIDLSHAAESTFYDVLECSTAPVIASHSSVRALCDHPRNLTDEQLKAIARKGGVVQLCLYKGFINKDSEKASLSDAIRHLEYMINLIGIDHVGIGSDFDGDGELIGCRSTNELINITMRLLELGYSDSEIEKIWGGNLLRVMKEVQGEGKPS